jgi:hypothetical protein
VPKNVFIALLIFLLTALFYLYTLLPSAAWGDGIKLQSEAIAGESFVLAEMTPEEFSPDPFPFSRVGVAAWDHPLYIVLGHLLVETLPSVDPFRLVNLISAMFGAASITVIFLLSHRWTGSFLASGYAALSLAVSHTFWWHSSTPEVYTLFAFLLLVSYYFFDHYERRGESSRLALSAFFWGLAASTHILAFLAIPALGLYYLLTRSAVRFRLSDARILALAAVGYLLGFSPYLIQFLRMSANFTFDEIIGPVVGSTFLSQLGALSPVLLGQSLLSYLFFLTVQFGPMGIVLGVLGTRSMFHAADFPARKIASFFAVFALFGVFYRVTDQFTFFIPSYLFWALSMGIGARYASGLLAKKTRFLFPIVLALLLLGTPLFYQVLPSLAARYGLDDDSIGIPGIGVGVRDGLAYYINPNKRGDYAAYEFGKRTVSALAPGAVVIAEWYTDTDEYFILRYFTKVRPLRSDVTVLGWPAQDPFSFDSRLVVHAIEKSFPEHPVYLASLSQRFYAASLLIGRYCIVPEGDLYRLYPRGKPDVLCLGQDAVTE